MAWFTAECSWSSCAVSSSCRCRGWTRSPRCRISAWRRSSARVRCLNAARQTIYTGVSEKNNTFFVFSLCHKATWFCQFLMLMS